MADKIQNIVVNYVANTQGLDELISKTSKLTKEEKDLADSFDKANKEASELEKGAKKIGPAVEGSLNKGKQSLSGFEQGVKKVGTAIIAAFAVSTMMSFGNEVLAVTSEFQKLSAVLTNTLGSSSMANRALADIKEFASVTPYGVTELTQSFVKLANQGFAPTTEELRKLGDLASSTGKGFDQLTEAIIDAQVGEFERLKDFGIRASKEGDKVSFTFKGVKTQTDFTNDSIRAYILSLGDLEGVSGAMAAISETLGGKISNLGDSYNSLLGTIGEGNSGVLSGAISMLNTWVKGIETSLLTTEQIEKKATDFAAKANGERILKYVNEDIKTLTDTQTEFNGSVVTTNQLLDINIKSLERARDEQVATKAGIDGQIASLDKVGVLTRAQSNQRNELISQSTQLRQSIAGQQYAIDSLNTSLNANIKAEETASEASKKAAAERKIQADKDFKTALDLLKQQEELAIRRGKLNGQTEAELNMVSQYYNDLRVDIYKRYGKAVGVVFEGVKLKGEELEKEYTAIVEKEIQARIKLRKDSELGALDQSQAEEKLITSKYYNEKLSNLEQSLLNEEITLKEYEARKSEIEIESGNKQITNQIDILEQKLNVKGLEASEITKTEQEIVDLQAKLRNTDLEDFISAEEKKTQLAKDQADKRKEILNAGFGLAISISEGIAQINKANTDIELADLKAKKAQELQIAGDNKQAQSVINTKYAKQEADIKRKQAQSEKLDAVFKIGVATAVAVAKASPVIPLMAFAAATGALQLALVASKPIPQYNKGTKRVPGVNKGYDSELSLLQPGEKVFSVATSNQYQPALDAIFDKKIPASVLNGMVMNYGKIAPSMAVQKESNTEEYLREIASGMKNLKQVNITVDKNGISAYLKTKSSETELMNNYLNP